MPFAETTLDNPQPKKDRTERMGTFDVAVIAEPVDPKSKAGKVVLVSDTDFIEDLLRLPEAFGPQRTTVSTYGVYENRLFMQQVLKYLKKRPSPLKVEIKEPQPYNMRIANLSNARMVLWLAMPGFLLLCGLFVFFVRRKV